MNNNNNYPAHNNNTNINNKYDPLKKFQSNKNPYSNPVYNNSSLYNSNVTSITNRNISPSLASSSVTNSYSSFNNYKFHTTMIPNIASRNNNNNNDNNNVMNYTPIPHKK